MAFVFISHSKYDIEIKNFFGAAIGAIDGLTPTMMELENLQGEYAAIAVCS